MIYLTHSEYQEFGLADITEEEFNPLARQVSAEVDAMTFGWVRDNWDSLALDVKGTVKEAVAYQVDYAKAVLGGRVEASKPILASESESVGGYSHSETYANSSRGGQAFNWSNLAMGLLAPFIGAGR